MAGITFIGGPLDGTATHRQRFPHCLAEDGTTPLPANTYQRRDDLYVHQLRVPGDGTKRHVYVHASRPLDTEANTGRVRPDHRRAQQPPPVD